MSERPRPAPPMPAQGLARRWVVLAAWVWMQERCAGSEPVWCHFTWERLPVVGTLLDDTIIAGQAARIQPLTEGHGP
jgi:hypothetical protein